MCRICFFIPAFIIFSFITHLQTTAQGFKKKVTISVVDAVTGKPIEGADVTFKALIGKLHKKTNPDGKAVFDMLFALQSYTWNYTVKCPPSTKPYKSFTGSITLLSTKNEYDYTASVQPEGRSISFKLFDGKQQPLSNATIKLKDDKGNELTAQTDATGIAIFDVAPDAGFANASLNISKEGFNNYTLPVTINEQAAQMTVIAPLAEKNILMAEEIPGPVKPKKQMEGPTTNVIQTSLPPGYRSKPSSRSWGPYKPECDSNPLASVPTPPSFAVESEKTLLDNISSACIGSGGEAVDALVDATENLISVSSRLQAAWTREIQNGDPLKVMQDNQKMYDNAKKIVEEEKEKSKKSIEDAIKKTKDLLENIKSLGEGPELFVLGCIWDGMKDYALPEDIATLKKSWSAFGKTKKALNDKWESLKARMASGKPLNLADRDLFTNWEDVTKNVQKTTEGLNLILAYLKDPVTLLPYQIQVNLCISTAESMIGTLKNDCQIRECDRQIKQGISVGQAALTGARKFFAQKQKCESKWRQDINSYVTKNFSEQDRGWEYFSSNDPRLLLLPEGAYGSWVNCHNEAIDADNKVKKMEASLTKLADLCNQIQPIAALLNERVSKYEQLYKDGLTAVKNCKLDEAEGYVRQMANLENSDCGHFFPAPNDKPESEELAEKIRSAKQAGICGTEKGDYILKKVIVTESNDYYKLSETQYIFADKNKPGKPGYTFTLLSRPPGAIDLKGKFSLEFSAICTEKETALEYATMVTWTKNTEERWSGLNGGSFDYVIVGKYKDKIIPSANGKVNVSIPSDYSGPQLVLNIQISLGQGASVNGWVQFVYEKANGAH